MKIVSNNGDVKFLMKAGKDFVEGSMTLSEAQRIVKRGKSENVSNFGDYNLTVDRVYYFQVEKTDRKKEKGGVE